MTTPDCQPERHDTQPLDELPSVPSIGQAPSKAANPSGLNDWVIVLLTGAVITVLMNMWYYLRMESRGWQYALAFGLLWGIGIGWMVHSWLKLRRERQADERQLQVPVQNNHLRKKGADRHKYILIVNDSSGKNETRIEFVSRLHFVNGLLLIAVPFQLLCLALWAWLHFPGVGKVPGWPLVIIVLMMIGWFIGGLIERLLTVETSNSWFKLRTFNLFGKKHEFRPWHLKVLGGCIIIALWGAFHWPASGWLYRFIEDDPYRLGLLAAIPLALWTASRMAYYLGSYVIVTDLYFRIGSTGYLLGSNPSAVLERAVMTNSTTGQTRFGRVFGFYIIKREGQGQADSEFARLRLSHGPELIKVLGG